MPKSKQDWLDEGLKVLGESGVNSLTIDALAERLNLTKGSFYHHFEDVQDFQEQLIAHWAEQYLSTSTHLPDDPIESLKLLDMIMNEVFSPITEPEVAIRMWAHENAMVRSFVSQVDAVRHEFVLHVFRVIIGDETQARLMADMLFTMTIGSITSLPRIPPERVLDLYTEFKRLYGLGD